MVNFKNITDVPVVESAEGLNLIVNDNGTAKQIAASAVGAQADFAVTDETNPAFIKNKPDLSNVGGYVVINLDDYGIGFTSLIFDESNSATKTIDGIEFFNVCDAAFNNNNQIKFSSSVMERTIFFDASTIIHNDIHEIFQINAQFTIADESLILEYKFYFIKNFNAPNSTTAIALVDGRQISLEPDEPSEPI